MIGGGSSAGLSLRVEIQERQELLEVAVDDRLVLHALEHVLHRLEVEPLAGDLGGPLIGVILGQQGLDLAGGLGAAARGVALGFADQFVAVGPGLGNQLVPARPRPRSRASASPGSRR